MTDIARRPGLWTILAIIRSYLPFQKTETEKRDRVKARDKEAVDLAQRILYAQKEAVRTEAAWDAAKEKVNAEGGALSIKTAQNARWAEAAHRIAVYELNMLNKEAKAYPVALELLGMNGD